MKKKSFDWSAFRRYLPYLTAYAKETWAAVVLGIAAGVSSVYMTYQIGQAVDQLIGADQVQFSALYRILLLFAGVVLVTVVSQWLIQRLGNRVAYLSVADLRKKGFAHLNTLPLRYYDQNSHGNIVSRFTNDMDNISIAVAAVFNQLFSGISVVLIALVVMLQMSVPLTLVVLVSTPIIFLVRGQKAQFSSSLTNPLSRFVDHLAYLSVGFVGGLLYFSGSGAVTVGVISSFTIYSSQFSKPFIELSGITTQIQTALAGLSRTFELLDQEPETADDQESQSLGEIKGEIAFEEVSFAYDPGQKLIEDFTFTAKPGETVAIVGKTGAGKSTLVNLLMRFYDVDKGAIKIDGTDIRQLKREELRQSFGMVLQDTWLFDASLRENLQYGNDTATDEEIYDALKHAYMYEYVMRLPETLDTPIGHQGIKISDGQRQLLTIARTMISNPPMLILDEATSSVDTLTEKKIQDAFLKMMEGKTSFVIAHRLSTIRAADKILVMDAGQIVEQGTHEELLAEQGYYYRLYHAQFQH